MFSTGPYWQVGFLARTTLGYLDAAPVWGIAESRAVPEAILGPLFLALVVALRVGLRAGELIVPRRLKK